MLNINQHNASSVFNFSEKQLKEIISMDNMEVILSNAGGYYDSDEMINIDEVEMEKLYSCL